jgi:hypothetical protein
LELVRIPEDRAWAWLHSLKVELGSRRTFTGKTYIEEGKYWYDYHQFPKERARTPLSIAFAFVATHNHFVLDRGGKVFNRSAPVIKLPPDATEDDHLALLGLLNSSTACFWMKQVFHSKGSQGINEGLKTEAWEHFREFSGTPLRDFPWVSSSVVGSWARHLDAGGRLIAESSTQPPHSYRERDGAVERAGRGLTSMISLQEELDWAVYRAYGLLADDLTHSGAEPPPLTLGERAFEIVMARKMAAGELETTWFERHGSTPITELPQHWPDGYRHLVERRVSLIESDRTIALIEQPEYKRRWNGTSSHSPRSRNASSAPGCSTASRNRAIGRRPS